MSLVAVLDLTKVEAATLLGRVVAPINIWTRVGESIITATFKAAAAMTTSPIQPQMYIVCAGDIGTVYTSWTEGLDWPTQDHKVGSLCVTKMKSSRDYQCYRHWHQCHGPCLWRLMCVYCYGHCNGRGYITWRCECVPCGCQGHIADCCGCTLKLCNFWDF